MNKLYTYLAYAGSIPFIIFAGLLTNGIDTIPLIGSTRTILSVYSVVIASFMAGSYWGQHLHFGSKWSWYLPIISNITALFLWMGFILLPFKLLLITIELSFILMLLVDQKLYFAGLNSRKYFQTRSVVTGIVVISLLLSITVNG